MRALFLNPVTAVVLFVSCGICGCGPSSEVLQQQDIQLQEMIQDAQIDPPGLSPAEKQRRRERLEMDFGPEAVPVQSSP